MRILFSCPNCLDLMEIHPTPEDVKIMADEYRRGSCLSKSVYCGDCSCLIDVEIQGAKHVGLSVKTRVSSRPLPKHMAGEGIGYSGVK